MTRRMLKDLKEIGKTEAEYLKAAKVFSDAGYSLYRVTRKGWRVFGVAKRSDPRFHEGCPTYCIEWLGLGSLADAIDNPQNELAVFESRLYPIQEVSSVDQ